MLLFSMIFGQTGTCRLCRNVVLINTLNAAKKLQVSFSWQVLKVLHFFTGHWLLVNWIIDSVEVLNILHCV